MNNTSLNKNITCTKCKLEIRTAWIRNNWDKFGPLKQLSSNFCMPQEVIEIIASNIAPLFHTVTSSQKRYSSNEIDICQKKHIICRNCLAFSIAHGLKDSGKLPYLRCHIGYFITPIKQNILEPEQLKNIIESELPEDYSCTYYRRPLPIIREGVPNLITSV